MNGDAFAGELRAIARTKPDDVASIDAGGGIRVGLAFQVFAGLCVVDNRENVDRTFAALAQNNIFTTRAGVWKPRTSPYDFQGHGKSCLPFVFELAGKHGMKLIAIEVLSPQHVDEIARALDETGKPTAVLLQVGTRNAQNFDLLKALGAQQEFAVLYKRGMGIRLEESLLAAEYIAAAGNNRVIFCLRGVQTHLGEPHRNLADTALIGVVKRLTKLPVCVDPSHAVGTRDDVTSVAMQGVVAGADMLLVDVHPSPEHALCDGPQALTLDDLPRFMDDVRAARNAYGTSSLSSADDRPMLMQLYWPNTPDAASSLASVRNAINDVDYAIIKLLERRQKLGLDAARFKRSAGQPIRDVVREDANRARRREIAQKAGVDVTVVDDVFERIVAWSRAVQENSGDG